MGFSLQANAKVIEGRQHEDRDAQFGYLNGAVGEHIAAGQPVISVDTKKKELVGDFKNGGREYQPDGLTGAGRTSTTSPTRNSARRSRTASTTSPTNTGWVSVGTDHDTSAFAVATLRRWWDTVGPAPLPARRPAADLRRRRRLQRLPGPRLEGRAGRVRRRDRPGDHRLPPAARAPANGTRSSTGCSPRSP